VNENLLTRLLRLFAEFSDLNRRLYRFKVIIIMPCVLPWLIGITLVMDHDIERHNQPKSNAE